MGMILEYPFSVQPLMDASLLKYAWHPCYDALRGFVKKYNN